GHKYGGSTAGSSTNSYAEWQPDGLQPDTCHIKCSLYGYRSLGCSLYRWIFKLSGQWSDFKSGTHSGTHGCQSETDTTGKCNGRLCGYCIRPGGHRCGKQAGSRPERPFGNLSGFGRYAECTIEWYSALEYKLYGWHYDIYRVKYHE